MTLSEAIKMLATRTISPEELVRDCLDRAEDLNPQLNAFCLILGEEATCAAKEARERQDRGQRKSAIDGAPVAVKDLFALSGQETAGGCKAYRGWVPESDSNVCRILKSSGSIILGKTNTDELGVGARTDTSYAGVTRNPWNTGRVPGGSSGGSAVAVATGMSLAAVGSDTGGSTRDPAAQCGVTGFKPTFGLIGRSGMLPFSASLDHVGILARTAEDCGVLLSILTGHDPEDEGSVSQRIAWPQAELGSLEGKRIGIVPRFLQGCEPDVERNFAASVRLLEEAGASVEECGVLEDLEMSHSVVGFEFYRAHKEKYDTDRENLGSRVCDMLRRSSKVTDETYALGVRERERIEAEVDLRMRDWDYLVGPTSPIVAGPLGHDEDDQVRTRNTFWFNITRQPAVSIPNGLAKDGMPTSLMLAARKYDDTAVLGVADLLQQRTSYHLDTPVVSSKDSSSD